MLSDTNDRPAVLEGGQPVVMADTVRRDVIDQALAWIGDLIVPPRMQLEQLVRTERLPFRPWDITTERVSPLKMFGSAAIAKLSGGSPIPIGITVVQELVSWARVIGVAGVTYRADGRWPLPPNAATHWLAAELAIDAGTATQGLPLGELRFPKTFLDGPWLEELTTALRKLQRWHAEPEIREWAALR